MNEYEYVHLVSSISWGRRFEGHREIISDYAAKGYRYVGFIPTVIRGYGVITQMDLVFEKSIDQNK